MPCFHPVKAFSLTSGGISFREAGDIRGDIRLPCGRCVGCRIDRARDWTLRILHELKSQGGRNCHFLTLTYDEQHLPSPPSIDVKDWQQFAKNVRAKCGAFRFFMCGEYGEKFRRPHYHAIVFGLALDDLKRHGGRDDMPTFRSASLDASWGKGHILIGSVTAQSASYVARYSLKKITGDPAELHYRWTDPDTGEQHQLTPEFCNMSRRPGIGATWYNRFHTDFHVHDFAVKDGSKTSIPRFYDKLAAKQGYDVDQLKQYRQIKALTKAENNSPERLAVREEVARARSQLNKRSL